MLNLQNSYWLTAFIANLFAYFITVSLTGYARAWAALQAGDDTAERMGYLTFNPAVHTNLFGLALLAFFGWGFGQHIFINPFNIRGKVRLLAAYFARPLAHLTLALCALVGLIALFGESALRIFAISGLGVAGILPAFLQMYPNSSSLFVAIGLILLGLIVINVMLTKFSFILTMVDLAFYSAGYGLRYDMSTLLLRFAVAISILLLLGPIVWLYAMRTLLVAGSLFSNLIGI